MYFRAHVGAITIEKLLRLQFDAVTHDPLMQQLLGWVLQDVGATDFQQLVGTVNMNTPVRDNVVQVSVVLSQPKACRYVLRARLEYSTLQLVWEVWLNGDPREAQAASVGPVVVLRSPTTLGGERLRLLEV